MLLPLLSITQGRVLESRGWSNVCGGNGYINLCGGNNVRDFSADWDGWTVNCPGSYTTICRYSGNEMCLNKKNGEWIVSNGKYTCSQISGHIKNFAPENYSSNDVYRAANGMYCKIFGPGQEGCF